MVRVLCYGHNSCKFESCARLTRKNKILYNNICITLVIFFFLPFFLANKAKKHNLE